MRSLFAIRRSSNFLFKVGLDLDCVWTESELIGICVCDMVYSIYVHPTYMCVAMGTHMVVSYAVEGEKYTMYSVH